MLPVRFIRCLVFYKFLILVRKLSSNFFPFLGLLTFLSSVLFAGENPTNKTFKHISGFIENKGQIIDQNNNPNPEVLYLLNTPGFNIQLRRGGFSYDVYSVHSQQSAVSSSQYSINNPYPEPGIRNPASGIRHPASGIRHPASGITASTSTFSMQTQPRQL